MDVKRWTMTTQLGRGAFAYEVHAYSENRIDRLESPMEKFVLASDYDALVAERDALKAGTDAQVWFHLQMENHRLTTERDSLLEALRGSKEALENGACTFDAMAAINDAYISRVGRGPEEWAQARAAWLDKESERNRLHASQLHALLEIVK